MDKTPIYELLRKKYHLYGKRKKIQIISYKKKILQNTNQAKIDIYHKKYN